MKPLDRRRKGGTVQELGKLNSIGTIRKRKTANQVTKDEKPSRTQERVKRGVISRAETVKPPTWTHLMGENKHKRVVGSRKKQR